MSSATPFQIIIVGGGIAGMAAAIALRGPNREITILEQSRLNTEIGATVSLQPNATRILQHTWKLPDVLENANGMVDQGFRVYNVDGHLVREIPLLRKTEYGADRIMWHRRDLHDYLKKMATSTEREGPAAVVRTTARVTGCDCERGEVTLANGETLRADLVIGADGIHSRLRFSVLGEEVKAVPTGFSAYRIMMPSEVLEERVPQFTAKIKPRDPYTSMIVAHNCRLIMGPARKGGIFSMVGLVPDERMQEDPDSAQSWVTEGDLSKMLDTFATFPEWTKDMFQQAESIGLWQLRDIDPLRTWTKGRTILIGDAAHAMLPTQGQGASQAIEDAEALGAYFGDFDHASPNAGERITSILQTIFKCRYDRATLIQQYSRQAARPATEEGSNKVTMRPDEFMDYNCSYKGAKEWQKQKAIAVPV